MQVNVFTIRFWQIWGKFPVFTYSCMSKISVQFQLLLSLLIKNIDNNIQCSVRFYNANTMQHTLRKIHKIQSTKTRHYLTLGYSSIEPNKLIFSDILSTSLFFQPLIFCFVFNIICSNLHCFSEIFFAQKLSLFSYQSVRCHMRLRLGDDVYLV